MTTINATLVKDGNSQAIRLTKTMLEMSGLSGLVRLEIKKGLIAIRPRTTRQLRKDWREQIEQELAAHGPLELVDDYGDLAAAAEATLRDGLPN